MSDAGRKPISDKVSESLTPDSQKTTFEKVKQTVTGEVDKAAAAAQPEQDKSFVQSVSDSIQKGHDEGKSAASNTGTEKPFAETVSEYVEAGKEHIAEAAAYLSGLGSGAVEGAKKGAEATKPESK